MVFAFVVALWLAACTSAPPPVAPPPEPVRDLSYLVSPTAGYPLVVTGELGERIESAHAALVAEGDPSVAVAEAESVLETDPGFHPAIVLLAQVDLVRGDDWAAFDRLKSVDDELPDYLAAGLTRARAADRLGEVAIAYDLFQRFALRDAYASRRARDLEGAAIDEVLAQFDGDLARGASDLAEASLEQLALWLGDEAPEVLEGRWLLAAAREDAEAELLALRELAPVDQRLEVLIRLAELEVDVGDLRQGLEDLENLAASRGDNPTEYDNPGDDTENPGDDTEATEAAAIDQRIDDLLERAKFLWRLQLLPEHVQELSRKGALSRADFASLIYWLFPSVRTSQLDDPPIANDIFDHPRRDEIVRVMDLDLLEVDRTIHRFDPEREVTRSMAFKALLMILERAPRNFACLGDSGVLVRASSAHPQLCALSAQCLLIPEPGDCLPAASISGSEALELVRTTLDMLGSG